MICFALQIYKTGAENSWLKYMRSAFMFSMFMRALTASAMALGLGVI